MSEKKAGEWINRIRQDLIGDGVKKATITPKVIRDNVAVLVEDAEDEGGSIELVLLKL